MWRVHWQMRNLSDEATLSEDPDTRYEQVWRICEYRFYLRQTTFRIAETGGSNTFLFVIESIPHHPDVRTGLFVFGGIPVAISAQQNRNDTGQSPESFRFSVYAVC